MNGPGPPPHTPDPTLGQSPSQIDYHPRLHIVLHEPEIPPNTGAVGRTCLAVGAKLWLIRPLGFRIDQKTLRRAGLDYWRHLAWEAVDNYAALDTPLSTSRRWFFTKTADRLYTEVAYEPGDAFVFGSESRGLPPSLLEAHRDRLLRIPIRSDVRSLNLSCAVAVAAYEAVRQWTGGQDERGQKSEARAPEE